MGSVPKSALQSPVSLRRQIVAAVMGNALEVYDFVTYAYFAVYIGQTFFPSENATASLLASLATFGAGFVTRPVGAFFIGRVADTVGRRPALLLSFTLMGVANLALALAPSYAQIGVAASVLIVFLRMLQGFAIGGEIGPSAAFLLEVAPPGKRGLFVSFHFVGSALATLVAGLVAMGLASIFDQQGLTDYGWRLAILLGASIIPIGLFLRRNLQETLGEEVPEELDRLPDGSAQRRYFRPAIIGVLMLAAGSTLYYVSSYMATYAIVVLQLPATIAFTGTAIGGLVGLVLNPVGGWLSDHVGRKPVMIFGWTCLLVLAIPAFWLILEFRTPEMFLAMKFLMSICAGIAGTPVLVWILEALPKHVRAGGMAMVYAFANMIFGGTTQFNIALLTEILGNPLVPAYYLMVAIVVGVSAMAAVPETAPAVLQSRGALGRRRHLVSERRR